MTGAIELAGLRVRYKSRASDALDVDRLSIPDGQRVAILGHSGSGKTTLLKAINGLVRPSAGGIRVLGADLADPAARGREHRRRIGLVFQEFNLIERASVYRNVLNGRLGWAGGLSGLLGRFSETDRMLAMEAIDEAGLTALAGERADALSGGQRQRVAIARVLAQAPDLLCADEPVSNLDPVLSAEMLGLIAAAGRKRGATVLMVVHHPALARRHAERIIGMADGRIVHDGDAATPLDAVALRAIYGRSLPPEPVSEHIRDDDDLSQNHVA